MREKGLLLIALLALLATSVQADTTIDACPIGPLCIHVKSDDKSYIDACATRDTCEHVTIPPQAPSIPPTPALPGPPAVPSLPTLPLPGSPVQYVPHPPILITSDTDFLLPTSGVMNPLASGTSDDPYVIQGWDIIPVTIDSSVCIGAICKHLPDAYLDGVNIQNTNKHVVIRNNRIHDDPMHVINSGLNFAFLIVNANNATVENNQMEGLLRAVRAYNTQGLMLSNNTITRMGLDPVKIVDSARLTIIGNDVDGTNVTGCCGSTGVFVTGSMDVLLAHNYVHDHIGVGISIWDSERFTLRENEIRDNRDLGLYASGSSGIVEHSSFSGNPTSVYALLGSSDALVVTWNNLLGNRGLVSNNYLSPVEASSNWWGCPTGPNTDGCSTVQGPVRIDSWLTSPVVLTGPPG